MPTLSNERLYERDEMLGILMRAGQFAHLSADDLGRSLGRLWNIGERLAWRDSRHNLHAPAERAVSIALVKAAQTGLIAPRYFDAQTVDWVARTEPQLCCLCFTISAPTGGSPYDTSLDFICYAMPTFARLDAPYYVRRPLCNKCAWGVAGRVWREEGQEVSVADGPDHWGAILAHLMCVKSFKERVRASAPNMKRLRFDPRREPQRIAA